MFFIDFGNKADIEAADIRSIDQELLNYPRFALRFALDGILTQSGNHTWTTDANELIQEKIVNKRSFVKTRLVDGETLVCDITTESGEDLRQLLETKKLAVGRRCLFQDLPQEKIDLAKENIDAFGMYTESPYELYVWLGDLMKHNSDVEEITATLAPLNRGSIYEPCLGELCAGFVEIPGVEDQWYRVVVEEIKPNSALVQLIDYGNRAEVKFTDITALPNEPPVLKVASKAYKVTLDDLCCFGQEWSEEAINFIKGQTELQKLVVEIVNDKEQPISVKISTATGDDIVELFVKSNFGRWKSRSTFTKKFNQSDLPNQQITANDLSIIVRHVRDPWLINGQLNEPDEIRRIKEVITKSTSSKTVYPVEVEEICAGFSIKYGEWHRVLIESISENSANVELIDYGDTDQIALTKLAPLPEELLNIPIQSVSCYMDDIAPPNSDRWSPEIKKELEALLLNNSSNIHINSIDGNQAIHGSMTIEKEPVSNILVSRDLAKWKNNGCQTAVAISSTRPMIKDLLTIKLPDEKTAVALVEFKSPAEFYLQLFDNNIKSNELSNSLLEKYKEDFSSYIPVVDEICAGYFPSFEQFYRVRVLSIHEKTATVLAVDFGSLEDLPIDDIKPLSAEFLTIPQQAIRVGLYNKDAIEWSNDAMKHFILNCMDTKIYSVVKERESAAGVLVQLIHAEYGDVIENLCKNGFAHQTNETREPLISRPESVPTPAAPTETLLKNVPPRNIDKFTKMPILEVPDFCEVMVTHVENMNLFYVLDIKNGEEFNDLVVFMNNYCNEHPKHSYCPHVDELCCAFSCEVWNRAYVQEVKSSKARVYFIDFGNTEELEFDKLRPFSDELLSLPSVAFPASFLEHEVSTNPAALDEFKSICKEQLLTMNVLSRDENTLKVSLSYSGTDILEMLKLKFEGPCHEEVQKIAVVEKITEEVSKTNSAGETAVVDEEVIPSVAVKTVEKILPSAAEIAVLESDTIIKTPITNNGEIELPSAEAETKLKIVNEISTDSNENNSYTPTENDVLSRLPNSCHPYESVTLKLPRCTFPNAVERMVVTKIYTPYLIFGYPEKRREEIDKLSLDLEEYFKQSQADEQIPLKAGTLCVVQDDDAKFRRGVLKTVTRTNSVVFMFDIGIEKSVQHAKLKVLDKKFKNVMNVQGIPMKLLQVRPSNDQDEWSEEAIKALKDIIEGQVVRVLPKFTESFIVNVKMKIDDNNDPVEKLFEDTGHAEVFQPVITEQVPSSSNVKKGVPMEKVRELIQLQEPPVNVKNFEIKVTCSVSPSLFYGQLYDKHNFEKCFKLSDELKELVEEGRISQEEKALINIDKLCIVKFSDNNYYRGYVIEKAGSRAFILFLIDYGIKEKVLTENLWPLPEAHVKYPAQSMLFQLQFITPPKRTKANTYSKEACEVFESLVRAKRMDVELIKTHGYVYRVVIRDHQTGVDIGERLIELGHAEHLFPKSKWMKHPYKDRSYFSGVSPRALLEETPPQSLMSSYAPVRARRGNTKQVNAERFYDHEYGNYPHYQNGYQNGYYENYNQYQYKQTYPSQRMGRQEFFEGDYYREEPISNRGRYQGRGGNHGQHQQATNFKGRGATSQPPQRGVRGRGKFFYNQNTDEKDRSSSRDIMNGDITRYVNNGQVNPYSLNGHDQGHCDHNGPSRGESNYHSNYESAEYSSAHRDSKFPRGGKFNHQPRQRGSGKFRGHGGTGRGRGSFNRDV